MKRAYGIMAALGVLMLSTEGAARPLEADCLKPEAKEILELVSDLHQAVASEAPERFLELISDNGLDLSTDGGHVSLSALESAFRAKTGVYCDFFACQGRAPHLGRALSGKPDLPVFTLRPQKALATISLNGASSDELNLSFERDAQCHWKLNGISGI